MTCPDCVVLQARVEALTEGLREILDKCEPMSRTRTYDRFLPVIIDAARRLLEAPPAEDSGGKQSLPGEETATTAPEAPPT